MKTEVLSKNNIEKAAKLLKKGELVAIPTETVYGLAADINSVNAINKIFEVKKRSKKMGLSVHISKFEQIYDFVEKLPLSAKKLAEKFWPGPLTIVLPKKENVSNLITANSNSVGIRFTSNKVALDIIKSLGNPVVASSANISGKPSPTCIKHVLNNLNEKISAIIDGENSTFGIDSTIICFKKDSTTSILRTGIISREEIENIIGKMHKNYIS